jgi:hypothetical protein
MLAWQNLPADTSDPGAAGLTLGDLDVTQLPVNTGAARMDLSFSLAERFSAAGDPAGIGNRCKEPPMFLTNLSTFAIKS